MRRCAALDLGGVFLLLMRKKLCFFENFLREIDEAASSIKRKRKEQGKSLREK
jgi:hypothetical protein